MKAVQYLLTLLITLPQGLLALPPNGNIIDLRSGETISSAQLNTLIHQSDYVLVGERHDNPAHHQIENWLLHHLIEQQQITGVAMEMIAPIQQAAIDRSYNKITQDLKQQLNWEKHSQWSWQDYGPLIELTINAKLPLLAANLDVNESSALYRKKQQHPLSKRLNSTANVRKIISQQLQAAHCYDMDADQLDAMLLIQLARDRRMADTVSLLLKKPKHKTTVLFAGAYHVRKDVGAARYIALEHARHRGLILGLVEENPNHSIDPQWQQQFDIVWITEAIERPDYCAKK